MTDKSRLLTDEELTEVYYCSPNYISWGLQDALNKVAKAQNLKTSGELYKELEKQVFYVDSRGYIALKPNATKNWLSLKAKYLNTPEEK